jgi:threonine synthase
MALPFETRSLAISQKSLGPGTPSYPLLPTMLRGCTTTSTDEMQYPLEVDYDYGRVTGITFSRGCTWGDWKELLPPRHPGVDMPVGGTPFVDVSALAPRHLGDRKVLVKDESRNPTWSHKDRLNTFTISAALCEGAKTIIVASSGNHGVSAAAIASRAGLNCIVLTMSKVSGVFHDMILGYGAYPVFLQADARWPAMRVLQEIPGTYPVSNLTSVHTGHPWGPEGYKTLAYEMLSDLCGEVPAAVVVPTGYGEMLYGLCKGFREARLLGHIDRVPQLISVEPASRGPLYHAIKCGRPAVSVEPGPTIQLGTATTVNSYRAVVAVMETNGKALLVTDDDALRANRLLAGYGLWQEVSSSAALAALDQVEGLDVSGPIVLMGCSAGLKEPSKPRLVREVAPDLPSLRHHLRTEFRFEL